ncbi:MAG: class I SAM-dependent methyltransferase [Phycisphaerae bacterium]|nr:class I SAM-dependent methyltransferase [Phycisphaerae bacterium]
MIAMLDAGGSLVGDYTEEYWQQERVGAIERASGVSLCRAGEAILYCRRLVRRFLDLGAGPGFLLQELHRLIDPSAEIFHGVEKYPPPYAASCPNFHIGGIEALEGRFDAGVCIEVVEHLTPRMLDRMLADLATVSEPGSLWLFNTGMPDYVRNEDPAYLDPRHRGHIISYSLAGVTPYFEAHGFRVSALPGRSFGFFVEFEPSESPEFDARLYHPVPENLSLLQRNGLLHQASFEAARSYYYQAEYMVRTQWALSLDEKLRGDARAPSR